MHPAGPHGALDIIWPRRLLSDIALGRGAQLEDNDTISAYLHASGLGNFPPEQREFLRNLTSGLLFGRGFVKYYNRALLVVLFVFTVRHVLERRRCRRRCRGVDGSEKSAGGRAVGLGRRKSYAEGGYSSTAEASESSSSSSSSSSSGSTSRAASPPVQLSDPNVDLERLPLLGSQRLHDAGAGVGPLRRIMRHIQEILAYQPRPLLIINRALPSNATSLLVLSWLALNLFFLLYRIHLSWVYFFCFATRSGDVFIVNLPLLYFLAAKNQPLKLLTGASYESLNIFHRRVGEWMCLLAALHSLGLLAWQFILQPEWLHDRRGRTAWQYLCRPIIYRGLVAFFSYEMLYFTSLSRFRQRWYEMFLASHIVLQVVALFFLYRHFRTARPYVLAALAIFVVDRLVWRLVLRSDAVDADVCVLPDGETVMLSASWDRAPPRAPRSWWTRPSGWLRLLSPRQSIGYGWKPTDHVFLSVPALGRTHMLQAHPFTIASPAPEPSCDEDAGEDDGENAPRQQLRLLIRAQTGFTADLLSYACRQQTVRVRLDGPYGSTHALDMLRAADNAILVAGGSGIAVTLPLAWALVHARKSHSNEVEFDEGYQKSGAERLSTTTRVRAKRVRMLWVIHSEQHRHWVPSETLQQLVRAGVELVIPPATAVGGRPDVVGMLEDWIGASVCPGSCGPGGSAGDEHEQAAVVASGPDGLNRMVRNTCARAMGRGADVCLAVEKFGW